MLFAVALKPLRGRKEALQFVTGYLIELSLSMDNVFVIALIFAYFGVPSQYQHRVLFWGILGALIMRGLMIGLGVALIQRLHWMLYLFGAFLLYSGVKMLFVKNGGAPREELASSVGPQALSRHRRVAWPEVPYPDRKAAKLLTPLALVLLMVETTDLLFAVDSIPAVFAVTTKPFIVFTSNVFAILGLRSLYFLLAGAIGYFRYLKYGLPLVLVFIGVEMLLDPHDREPQRFQVEIPTGISLLVVAGIILISIVLSVMVAEREKRTGQGRPPEP